MITLYVVRKVNIADLFDEAAESYDSTRRKYISCISDLYGVLVEQIPFEVEEEFDILDLGAGTGLLTSMVKKVFPNANYTLVDISTEMLEKAKERFIADSEISYISTLLRFTFMLQKMKTTILLAIVLSSLSATAGSLSSYTPGAISEYFSDGKVYYRGISDRPDDRGFLSSKVSSSRCVNLQVFDLDSGKDSKVFKKDLKKNLSITGIVFEGPSAQSNRSLHFSSGYFQNQRVSKDAKDRVIIIVYDSDKSASTLWSMNRLGKDLKEITTVAKSDDWHIDSTNEKIRVFTRKSDGYQMREYPW